MIENFKKKSLIFGGALFFAFSISFLFYPGFMSYDTLHALRGARNGVSDSMWPPMVSYVWRVVDGIWQNPVSMLFSQIFILFLSLSIAIYLLTRKQWAPILFLISFLAIPSVLGTLAVIWKDVLMASIIFSGFALMLLLPNIKKLLVFSVVAVLIFILFLIATSVRHNAITATAPLLLYLGFTVAQRLAIKNISLFAITAVFFVVAVISTYSVKLALDHYSLPRLSKITSSKEDFLRPVRILDIAGASVCVGQNLFIDSSAGLTLDVISKNYEPKHVNLSSKLFNEIKNPNYIIDDWLGAIRKHPLCMLSNKIQLSYYLLGLNDGPEFLITHPGIDENEYGYRLSKSVFRDKVVSYIIQWSGYSFFKPWLLYLTWSLLLVIFYIRQQVPLIVFTLFVSGALYLVGLIFLGNAADARLIFYSTTAFYFSTFVLIFRANIDK